ncbi:hypothetical protein E2C01_087538 [Portunus trituberculatus]|uniref:Uncharacterized protein n=1 Tax=Portunus trituberculatus TaxID=210409 RepID=A0A5B7JHK5_PORTR|nr:hypothetical protein [Portunus trituberculatus]
MNMETCFFGDHFTILLTLRRVNGGQKINGHSFHYFNPPHEFLKL